MKPWGGKYGPLPPTYLSLETCVFFTEYQLHSKPNKRINRPQIPVVLLSSPTPPSAHSLFPCLSLPPIPSPTLVMPQVTHPCSYSCKLLTGGFRQWEGGTGSDQSVATLTPALLCFTFITAVAASFQQQTVKWCLLQELSSLQAPQHWPPSGQRVAATSCASCVFSVLPLPTEQPLMNISGTISVRVCISPGL